MMAEMYQPAAAILKEAKAAIHEHSTCRVGQLRSAAR